MTFTEPVFRTKLFGWKNVMWFMPYIAILLWFKYLGSEVMDEAMCAAVIVGSAVLAVVALLFLKFDGKEITNAETSMHWLALAQPLVAFYLALIVNNQPFIENVMFFMYCFSWMICFSMTWLWTIIPKIHREYLAQAKAQQ